MKIYEQNHIEIAKHFGKTVKNLLMAKRRYQQGKKSIWPIYCKAYLFDKIKEIIDEEIK